VVRALAALHRLKILHRNIHPDAVTIYLPSDYIDKPGGQTAGTWGLGNESFGANSAFNNASSIVSSEEASVLVAANRRASVGGSQSTPLLEFNHSGWGTKKKKDNKPVCELGDYWFLANPRKPGCKFSAGRADWGFTHTVPPEVLFNQAITDRSDIWAFGICVFNWATEGNLLMYCYTSILVYLYICLFVYLSICLLVCCYIAILVYCCIEILIY
jgi:serine/threonine protein kinase